MNERTSIKEFHTWHKHKSMINIKMITRVLGFLLIVEALFFVICTIVSLIYKESDYIYFIYSILINLGTAGLFILFSRKAQPRMTRRDGYCIVSLTWIMFTIFGMLPFYLSGYIPDISDAFFETMSGFTTTGATILNDIESLSNGMLFWRSLTQWIGGLGIVIFTIAVFPIFGGSALQLFSAESTGVTHDKIHPKISSMAKRLWMVYIILTLSEAILLVLGGMDMFDAVCHSFTTTSTGGYSTKQASIAYWNSPYIEYIVIIFMLLSSVNFSLYFVCLKRGQIKKLLNNAEFKWFMGSVAVLTLIIAVALYINNNYGIEKAFRVSLFQVSSIHTSCGYATDDYLYWPHFTWLLLIFAMLAGGCTGSTAGGIKEMRIVIFYRNIKNEFKRMIHPEAVLPVRVNKTVVSPAIVSTVKTFIIFYLTCLFAGWLALMVIGIDFTESFGLIVSSIGNDGPALGLYGPANTWSSIPDAAKWITSFMMLIGRLELFSVLLLFYPGFWSRR